MGVWQKLNEPKYKDSDVFVPGRFNPGLFELDKEKLKKLRPQIFGIGSMFFGKQLDTWQQIDSQMNDGDIETAVVISTEPLLVACLTEDLDAVVLLKFPTELGKNLGWTNRTRLLTVNAYNGFGPVRKNKDLYPGPNAGKNFKSFGPLIVDLYTSNTERLERKKAEIPEGLWAYTAQLGVQYQNEHPGVARDGLGFRFDDAKLLDKIRVSPKVNLE